MMKLTLSRPWGPGRLGATVCEACMSCWHIRHTKAYVYMHQQLRGSSSVFDACNASIVRRAAIGLLPQQTAPAVGVCGCLYHMALAPRTPSKPTS
jgi:hypothetical protein